MLKSSVVFCFFFLLIGCASQNKKIQAELKHLTTIQEYDKAIALVESEKFYPEERSRLLKLIELGGLHYLKGNFFQSLETLNQAQDLSDKLFTQSISKKVTSTVLSDSLDNYYGEKYERSMLRLYQALAHYQLYLVGKYEAYKKGELEVAEKTLSQNERRGHLQGARASILNWDTLLSTFQNKEEGENVYKVDMLAKIFGAFIHEEIGTSADRQIARQLYLDAKKVLFQNYNRYPSFNFRYGDFQKNYSKFAKMKESEIQAKYVEATDYAKSLLAFIDSRLRDLNSGNKENVKIFLREDYIAEKKAETISFPLPISSFTASTTISANSRAKNNQAGQQSKGLSLLEFALFAVGVSSIGDAAIHFELPTVETRMNQATHFAVISDSSGKEILKKEISLVNPLSEIAKGSFEDKKTGTYTRIGTRVALKHVAAIVAAYAVYQNQPNALGQTLAFASYYAASRGIKASEEADLRFWSTLPSNIGMSSFSLKEGVYSFHILKVEGDKSTLYPQDNIVVKAKQRLFVDIKL